MNKLIIEMLDLSRLENNVQAVLETIDVANIIQDCLNELNSFIEKKQIEICKNIKSYKIQASPNDLFKLIRNIIENAIIYNVDKGTIYITLKNKKLIIEDTGIGMSQEDVEHIFERFYRVDKARSKESSGTGLGLSIVKHICLLYGYKIDVKTKLGLGTTFTITLD